MSEQDKPAAESQDLIQELFSVGAHIGYSKARRHPSQSVHIYGLKNRIDIIDLEKTRAQLAEAVHFLSEIAAQGGTILLVGGKAEARRAIQQTGEATGMPFVAGRWIGGTLTNFSQIRKQVDKLQSLREDRDKGELSKYTKREQLSFDREIADLERYYSGLIPLKTNQPEAMVIIDPKQEHIALKEALVSRIPTVAMANTDCDISKIDHSVPANDSSQAAVDLVVGQFREAILEGLNRQAEAGSAGSRASDTAGEQEKQPAEPISA